VTDNILKRHVECTCDEYVEQVAGRQRKPFLDALKTSFSTVVLGKSTLVKEMSSFLRENQTPLERKRVQELMSSWLITYDFASLMNPHLLRAASAVTDEDTLAVDFSDISKEFGGEGMEGMERGWDGSRHCTAMGHDFLGISLVGSGRVDAKPVYAKLGRGRHSKSEMLETGIDEVMAHTGGRGWIAVDRGMDDASFIADIKRKAYKTVVRIKEMKRDVFGNGRPIDETLSELDMTKVLLRTYRGDRSAEIRCQVGHGQYCKDPMDKDAIVENVGVIVVESRFDDHSIFLYVVCPDEILSDPKAAFRYAVRAAQAYCDRWQIETSFLTVKQEFALEKVRVRKFRRLENIFALCLLAYDFMTSHIRESKRFKGVVKALKDNVADVALKTHSLLLGIRALAEKTRIRFISGRPRTRGKLLPGQLTLSLTAWDGSAYCL